MKLSEILGSWSLPALSAAVAKAERDDERKDTIANFNALVERFGGERIKVN